MFIKQNIFNKALSLAMRLLMLLRYCNAWNAKHFELSEKQFLPGQKMLFLH